MINYSPKLPLKFGVLPFFWFSTVVLTIESLIQIECDRLSAYVDVVLGIREIKKNCRSSRRLSCCTTGVLRLRVVICYDRDKIRWKPEINVSPDDDKTLLITHIHKKKTERERVGPTLGSMPMTGHFSLVKHSLVEKIGIIHHTERISRDSGTKSSNDYSPYWLDLYKHAQRERWSWISLVPTMILAFCIFFLFKRQNEMKFIRSQIFDI